MTGFDWFVRGAPIANVYERSSDAEYILDADYEEDFGCKISELLWRECLVPIEAFQLTHTTLAEHIGCVRGADAAYEEKRLLNIRSWMSQNGGASNALNQSPLIASLTGGTLRLEDGWHRLGIAVYEYGLKFVPVICAKIGSEPVAGHIARFKD